MIAEGVMDLDARCNLPSDGEIEVFFSDHQAKMRNSAVLSLSLPSLDQRGQMPFGHANNKDGTVARLSCGNACPLYHACMITRIPMSFSLSLSLASLKYIFKE